MDYGMDFKDQDILSTDGVRLSAWLIEAPASKKLAVVNHPLGCTRYGSTKGLDGVPVNFMPMLKALHDDKWNIVTFDQRAQGKSDGNYGKKKIGEKEVPCGVGALEYQDLHGVLNWVKEQPGLKECEIALATICMGANAAFRLWSLNPEAYGAQVKCQLALQPTISNNMMGRVTKIKMGYDVSGAIDDKMAAFASEHGTKDLRGVSSLKHVTDVKVPVLFVQVKADVYTSDHGVPGNDVQKIYDACPTEKELLWIGPGTQNPHGTGKRFEGYSYFNEHPEKLLAFFNKHLGGPGPSTKANPIMSK